MLKFTLVADNDTTVHDVHTSKVACSPSVLIKCRISSYHQTLARTPHEWLKNMVHGNKTYCRYFIRWRWERRVVAIVARFQLCRGGQLAGRAQLWCRALWWTVVAGLLLLVEPVCCDTQEEQVSGVSHEILSDLECR